MNMTTQQIPHGLDKQLFCYTDFTPDGLAFAATTADWRLLTGKPNGRPVRVAVRGVELPHCYKLNGCGLAMEGIIRL